MKKGAQTRYNILKQAFELIYKNGYQATSIDKIIQEMPVTKGAFFYHFDKKEQLGLAVLEEIIYPNLNESLIAPLESSENPVEDIYEVIKSFLLSISTEQIRNGCSTNNMIKEMASLDENFRKILQKMLDRWLKVIQEALERGKKNGNIRPDVDSAAAAEFIVVGYEGVRSLGKVYQNVRFYQIYLSQLKHYLHSLQ